MLGSVLMAPGVSSLSVRSFVRLPLELKATIEPSPFTATSTPFFWGTVSPVLPSVRVPVASVPPRVSSTTLTRSVSAGFRSRTKASTTPFTSPAVSVDDSDSKPTCSPSPLTTAPSPPSETCTPEYQPTTSTTMWVVTAGSTARVILPSAPTWASTWTATV